jgi:2,4-dienoyl-CoA reductase-like NADH-dependent reductase (Old Yellow Enzyme family)
VGEPVTLSEIEDLFKAFVQSALNAKKAGFDGIEIHGAHSGLIHNFLSPDTNKRTDTYGFHNRTLFAEKVVQRCREVVGETFPILFRLSNFQMYDFEARLAQTPKELAIILSSLTKAGVDIYDCSALDFKTQAFKELTGSLAYWTKKLSNQPVITVGSIGSSQPFVADIADIIQKLRSGSDFLKQPNEEGQASFSDKVTLLKQFKAKEFDLIALGRPILLDANWLDKLNMEEMT